MLFILFIIEHTFFNNKSKIRQKTTNTLKPYIQVKYKQIVFIDFDIFFYQKLKLNLPGLILYLI